MRRSASPGRRRPRTGSAARPPRRARRPARPRRAGARPAPPPPPSSPCPTITYRKRRIDAVALLLELVGQLVALRRGKGVRRAPPTARSRARPLPPPRSPGAARSSQRSSSRSQCSTARRPGPRFLRRRARPRRSRAPAGPRPAWTRRRRGRSVLRDGQAAALELLGELAALVAVSSRPSRPSSRRGAPPGARCGCASRRHAKALPSILSDLPV